MSIFSFGKVNSEFEIHSKKFTIKLKIMKNIFLISALLLLFSCGKDETKKEEFEVVASENQISVNDAQFKTAGIEIGTLGQEEISAKIKLSGMVDVPPQNLASVSAPSGGYVKYTRFMPGMHVSKGETLAILEDPQIVQLQQDLSCPKIALHKKV